MAVKIRADLKAFFQTGDKPTQVQFEDLIDSSVPFAKLINDVDSPYSVGDDDWTLFADASSGNVDIILPLAAVFQGRALVIKKIDSSGNRVRLQTDGSDQIDGSTTLDNTTQYKSFQLQSDKNQNWYITASYFEEH